MKLWGAVVILSVPVAALAQPAPADPTAPSVPETVPAPAPAPAPPPPPVPPNLPPIGLASEINAAAGYDNGLYIATRDDAFKVGVGGWIMGRWELGELQTSDNIDHRFVLPSSRIVIAGHAFATADFQLSTEISSGTPELRDAYIDQPLPTPKGVIRIGQFKPYFSRQQLVSRSQVAFTERAPTFDFAGIYRDIGAAIHHEPRGRDGGLELGVGIFNGAGSTPRTSCTADAAGPVTCELPTTAVDAARPLVTGRIALRSARLGVDRDDDLGHGELRAAIGIGYAGDLARAQARDMTHQVTADLIVKGNGVSLVAAGFWKSIRESTGRTNALAWHAQLGYAIVPNLVELAARVAQVPVSESDDHAHEALAAVNIYRRAHRWKWHIEGGGTHVTGDSGYDWLARVQTQLIF